jgi:hypothetical protein
MALQLFMQSFVLLNQLLPSSSILDKGLPIWHFQLPYICTNVQLDLYTQIILSLFSVYQSANKSICNNDTWWKLKINHILQFTTELVWVQNPDSQPTKVIPPINSSVPPRHHSLVRLVMALSLTSNRYRKHIPLLELRCLLQSPAMRSNAGMANRQGDGDLHFTQVSAPS